MRRGRQAQHAAQLRLDQRPHGEFARAPGRRDRAGRTASARDALTATLTNHQPTAAFASAPKPSGNRTKEQKRAEAQARQARSQKKKELEARIAAIETDLAAKEKRNTEVIQILQDSAVWADPAKAMTLQEEHDALTAAIEKLTHEWEAKASELETLTGTPESVEQE